MPACRLATSGTFLGVSSSSRQQPMASTLRKITRLALFRPRSFSLPRRFAPPPALQVYFTLQPRPGFTLQGFSPRRSRPTSSVVVCPLAVADTFTIGSLRHQRHKCVLQFQGFAPRRNSLRARGGLVHIPLDPLLSFASSGLSVDTSCHRFRGSSAHDLECQFVHARSSIRPPACRWRAPQRTSLEVRSPARGF
jgi:hypothetical protein